VKALVALVSCTAIAVSVVGAAAAQAQSLTPFGVWSEQSRRAKPPVVRRVPPPAMRNDDLWGFDEPRPQTRRAPRTGPELASGGARPNIVPKAPQSVAFRPAADYAPGTIVIDVGGKKLFHVRDDSTADAYPIGVGRIGFSWTGVEKVSRIASWPDWHPPEQMRQRQPYLPVKMTGGIRNPLGARAIYLGNTLYRIHGTNDPKSIGRAESSGCFRMMNEHVAYLAERVEVGAEVHVVKSLDLQAPPQSRPRTVEAPSRPQEASFVPPAADVLATGDDDLDDDYFDVAPSAQMSGPGFTGRRGSRRFDPEWDF
jgi:lipoprotein-anchoring transpeptidase ErfK/SrfK